MLFRLKRTALTFVMLVGAYLLYAVVVVPLVEPPVRLSSKKKRTTAPRPSSRSRNLDHLFAPGSWELGRPKVIETDHGTLLFDEYKPLPDGRLELTRCTVICYVDNETRGTGQSVAEPAVRRPVILRAQQGATLNFDQSLNLLRGQFGRLLGGRLLGEVTINSPPSGPDQDDAIAIVTRNIQLDTRKIWTPHEVTFRYGPNTGKGRDLTILLAKSGKSAAAETGFDVGGVRSLELNHLDQLQLEMNDSGLFGRQPAKAAVSAAPDGHEPTEKTFVEVTCRGPFRFDLERQFIMLEDQVELVRNNRNGLRDQLQCDLLEIHFATATTVATGKAPARPQKSEPGKWEKLTPHRVIASGYPVIIRAASVGVATQAERVEYDCILRRVWLKDRDKVMLQDPQRAVEAREIRYALGENGRLGDLAATGPGVLRGQMGTAPARPWQVTWQDQVILRRLEGTPVLSFTAKVQISLPATGSFVADTLHLYLRESPHADNPEKVKIEPDRMHALGNVVVDSPDLYGEVGEARLWFRSSPISPEPHPDQAGPAAPTPATPLDSLASFPGGPAAGTSEAGRQKFELRAQLVEALVFLGDHPVADRLVVRGNVDVREVTPGVQQPVAIRGDLFELQDGATRHPRGALLGQPAEVVARGLRAVGERLHIYPGDNQFHIVGRGEMTLTPPPPQDANEPPSPPTTINWKDQMEFDGQTAQFAGGVAVHLTQYSRDRETRCVAMGDLLRVQLTRRVDFQNPKLTGPVGLAEFNFDGWGFLDIELTDPGGERRLSEQIQVRQLTFNYVSGELRGEGPGWLRGIHRGQDLLQHDPASPSRPAAPSLAPSAAGLHFLRVDFQRSLMGNLHQRQLEFQHGTRTLYGPVASWNDALDQLPENQLPANAVVLTCDRLAVAQPGGERSADQVELEATGNALAQGKSFSASGGRISYARGKDQLILEGDGRSKATLAFQKEVGSPPSNIAAGKILFWPSTRQFQLIDFKQSEIYDVGQLRSRPAPRPGPR